LNFNGNAFAPYGTYYPNASIYFTVDTGGLPLTSWILRSLNGLDANSADNYVDHSSGNNITIEGSGFRIDVLIDSEGSLPTHLYVSNSKGSSPFP
jgi:hypothetical protein